MASIPTSPCLPLLRTLPLTVRIGISCLVLVLLGGLAASAMHLFWHYENRDERPGMTMDDLEGAYHGVERTAPILMALTPFNHLIEFVVLANLLYCALAAVRLLIF